MSFGRNARQQGKLGIPQTVLCFALMGVYAKSKRILIGTPCGVLVHHLAVLVVALWESVPLGALALWRHVVRMTTVSVFVMPLRLGVVRRRALAFQHLLCRRFQRSHFRNLISRFVWSLEQAWGFILRSLVGIPSAVFESAPIVLPSR